MIEAKEPTTKAPEITATPPASPGDMFAKFAKNLDEKKATRVEAEKTTEATREQITEPVIAETPVVENKQNTEEVKEVVAEVTTETQVDSKVKAEKEVTAKKEDTVVVPEKSIEDDLSDLGFTDKKETTTKETEVVDNSKVINTYKERIAELEAIANDPLMKAYKAAKESGKDVSSFINDIKGPDVKSMTSEQKWKINLENEGLSAEEVAQEMEIFAELRPFEQKQKTKEITQRLEAEQSERLSKYASDNKSNTAESAKKAEELAIAAQAKSREFFDSIKDKEWQGMKMTASESKKLENYLNTEFNFTNADGSPNYELYAKVGNYALNERTILQNTYKKGETRGYEKALLELSRANKNDKRFNSAPDTKTTNKQELARQAAKEAFGSKTN